VENPIACTAGDEPLGVASGMHPEVKELPLKGTVRREASRKMRGLAEEAMGVNNWRKTTERTPAHTLLMGREASMVLQIPKVTETG